MDEPISDSEKLLIQQGKKTSRLAIDCFNVPDDLFDRVTAKEYFQQFGRVTRMYLRPNRKSCTVEYYSQAAAEDAYNGLGEFKGELFEVFWKGESPQTKKTPPAKKKTQELDPEVKAELDAMGVETHQSLFRPEVIDLDPPTPVNEKLSKQAVKVRAKKAVAKALQRRRISSESAAKKREKSKTKGKSLPVPSVKTIQVDPGQVAELLAIINASAHNAEEQFRVLEARDKLIRIHTLRERDLTKATKTVGTCPDMCPEKERLMREAKHQVAMYEQEIDENGEPRMNHKIAIKQYSRSSADQEVPLPHELRPVSVLQLTMGYLLHRIVNMCEEPDVNIAEWYHFMWDRTRGIRKDITQQELCCLGSVELVEQCARFHIHCAARLVAEDPSVCDQKINTENLTKCLQTLKYMYHDLNIKNVSCPNEAEFRGYIILLNLGDGNFMWEVQQLKLEIQSSPEVKFGIRVFSALDNNNYVSFFKLVRSTTYLNACILLRYFNKVRYRAINTIVKTYSGRAILTRMPITELQNILAFEDIQATISFLESYGLKFDETQIQVVLDRKSFVNTNTTYELERAINIIESKRKCSVSEIICGKALPPKNYEAHKLQCSFDNGFLKASEIDPKWSDKAIRNPSKLVLPTKFTSSSHSNVSENKQSATIAPSSVFAAQNSQSSSSIFNSPPSQPNILAVTDSAIIKASPFGNKGSQPSSIFGVPKSESFFGPSNSQPFPSVFKPLEKNIFGEKSETKFDGAAGRNIFGQSKSNQPAESNIFRERKTETTSGIFGSFTTTVKPSFGDGRSELMKAAQNKMIEEMKIKKQAELQAFLEEEKKRKLEEARIKAEEEARRITELEQRRIMEEAKKRVEEEARKKAEEEARKKAEEEAKKKAELEIQRRAEEARRKLEEDKRKAEEARRRAEEEARRRAILEAEMKRRAAEEKRLKEMLEKKERETAVFQLVESLLNKVEDVDRKYRLNEIKSKIQKRKLISLVKLWRHKVIVAKKKRKAVDDLPIWLPSLSTEEEAKELYTSSQNETLQNMKRYKLGKSQTFKLLQKSQRLKINIQKVVYTVLKKRMQDNANCIVNSLFWKVVISVPDQKESQRDVVDRLENVVDNSFDHLKPNFDPNVLVCEKFKPNASDTLAVCIQKNRGLNVPSELKFEKFDLMVLGINSEEFIDRINYRLCTFLRTKPKLSTIPIVLILRRGRNPVSETLIERTLKLDDLIENNLISDYCILFEDVLTKDNLISMIEKGLGWLASKTNEAPPLEMDYLQNVLCSSLTEEFTSRLNASASINSVFQKALNNPRVIVEVYNESINRLIDLLFDKRNLNYPSFPKNLKSFIDIEKSCPQKYERFPDFWRHDGYRTKIKNEISQLLLPVVRWDWPSKSLSQLKEQIRNYCTVSIKSSRTEKVFLKILSVILSHFDNDEDFEEKINKFSWLDVFEIIMTEKINCIAFNLKEIEFQIVVYNQNDMKSFKTYPWWYESRYVTDYLKSVKLPTDDTEQKNTKKQKLAVDDFELDFDIDKALEDITMSYNENTARVKRDDRSKFYSLFNDLKLTIDIHKQAVKKTDEILTAQIEKGQDINR